MLRWLTTRRGGDSLDGGALGTPRPNPLTPAERRRAACLAAAVLGLHLLGVALLLLVVAGGHARRAAGGLSIVGLGVTAYTLGLRHAFDADHISAIDNTTRKFMAEGRRPLSVGFWFSLGHSTVVFALAGLFAVGMRSLGGQVRNASSLLHSVGGTIGTGVSGGFLYLIAALNLAVLWGIIQVFREAREGHFDETRLEAELDSRGFMNRFFGRFTRVIRHPWQMYPVGVLFGLGFDTATEVSLLFLAAGAAGAALPAYAVLALPVLFAAGMSLLDTLDGSFMNFAYQWAFSEPARKVFYNLVITGLSVAVALVIGTVELAGLVAQEVQARGWFWSWLENINMSALGLVIGGMFVATWVLALAVWRFGRVEERWKARLQETGAA
jgi:nickel/cobalt transporter (NiCoT) family protein